MTISMNLPGVTPPSQERSMEHAVLKTDTGRTGPMLMFYDRNSDPSGCWYVGGSASDASSGPGGQPAGGKPAMRPRWAQATRGVAAGQAPPRVLGLCTASEARLQARGGRLCRHGLLCARGGASWRLGEPGRASPAFGRCAHRVPVLAPGRPRRPAGATAAGQFPAFKPRRAAVDFASVSPRPWS